MDSQTKPIFVLDFDGCIASQGKIWFEQNHSLGVYKTISDHDSWIIDTIKDKSDILVLSSDTRVNKYWCIRRGIDFLFTGDSPYKDKWIYLSDWLKEKYDKHPKYYYLGDAMPDFECMKYSHKAFYPRDASLTLKKAVSNFYYMHILEAKSGCGVFEEMIHDLIYKHGELPREILE